MKNNSYMDKVWRMWRMLCRSLWKLCTSVCRVRFITNLMWKWGGWLLSTGRQRDWSRRLTRRSTRMRIFFSIRLSIELRRRSFSRSLRRKRKKFRSYRDSSTRKKIIPNSSEDKITNCRNRTRNWSKIWKNSRMQSSQRLWNPLTL